MARFLNPSLWWLVSLGMWVSVCFVVVLFMTDNPGCHAVTNRLQSAVRMGIIAVPLFYLAVAGKGTLGSSAFDTRFIPDMLYPSTIEEADRQIDESGGMRTPSLMQLLSRPDDYHGCEVEVVGMAARQEDLAPDLLL